MSTRGDITPEERMEAIRALEAQYSNGLRFLTDDPVPNSDPESLPPDVRLVVDMLLRLKRVAEENEQKFTLIKMYYAAAWWQAQAEAYGTLVIRIFHDLGPAKP